MKDEFSAYEIRWIFFQMKYKVMLHLLRRCNGMIYIIHHPTMMYRRKIFYIWLGVLGDYPNSSPTALGFPSGNDGEGQELKMGY